MANLDNSTNHLKVNNYYKEEGYTSKSSLADLYNLQDKTQKMYQDKQGRKHFVDYTIGDLIDFLMVNNHALKDEIHELMDAVGGINDGVGNAAWKPWKSANKEIREKRLSDLSEGDLKELKMEYIDMLHFVFNTGLAIGITAEEIYNYYLSKNEENWSRQRRGY